MAGTKRRVELHLGGRARKLLCVMGPGSSVADGHPFGAPSLWKSSTCQFYEAPSSALASFDWSSLGAALDDEGYGEIRGRYEDQDYVFVPQAEWPVTLSKRGIFKEITRTLHLRVHGFGILSHEAGIQVAWVEVDVPPSEVGGVRGREKFHSERFQLRLDAIENVCSHAVAWFINHCCVKVKDLNYAKLVEVQGKVAAMDLMVSIYSDKLKACKEQVEGMQWRYGGLLLDAQNVLQKYNDIVPVGRAPVNRIERLVCELAAVIAKGDAMSAAALKMG